MKKKFIAAFACVAAVLALLSGTSLAYYTVTEIATNVITTGGMSVAVHETTANGEAFPAEGVSILPGDTVSKIVWFENTGSAPLYLRVTLDKAVKDSTLSAEDCLVIDLDSANWTHQGGYYYYNSPLTPGSSTGEMFTEVHFDADAIDNDYIGKIFTLDITAYAVQTVHNGATVLDAQGWPG